MDYRMSTGQKIGAALIAVGFGTPVVTYLVMLRVMAIVVANHPGGDPNLGAMLKGYLALVASVAVGILVIVIGVCVCFVSFWKSRKHSAAC